MMVTFAKRKLSTNLQVELVGRGKALGDVNIPWNSQTENHFVIFKPLSYCFQETIGFDVKASFASRPVSRLIS